MNDFFSGWENMCSNCGRKEISSNCNNANCDEVDNGHCVDKKTHDCIPPIKDCVEHWDKCLGGCHEECACQNP